MRWDGVWLRAVSWVAVAAGGCAGVVGGGVMHLAHAAGADNSFFVRLHLLPQPELGAGQPPEPSLPPLSLTDIRIFNVSAQRATSSARLSFRTEPQTIAVVRWGREADFTQGASATSVWAREHSITLPDLEPATRYFFRIEVRDPYGRTASYEGQFSTLKEGEIAELPLPSPRAFQARLVPGKTAVLLSWKPTDDIRARAVRIVRSTTLFPADPWDGEVVYEGRGTTFVDEDVHPGFTYFYTAFTYGMSLDGKPLYSSGVGAWIAVPFEREIQERESAFPAPEPSEEPEQPHEAVSPEIFVPMEGAPSIEERLEQLPVAQGPDAQEAQRLTLDDLIFLQGGLVIEPRPTGVVPIDGMQALTIRLPKEKTPPSLKSVVLVVRESPQVNARTLTVILRLTRDNLFYEATLPPFGRAGYHPFTMYLLSFQQQRLTRLEGVLRVYLMTPFQSSAPFLAWKSGPWGVVLVTGILSALSGLGMVTASWALGRIAPTERKRDHTARSADAAAVNPYSRERSV